MREKLTCKMSARRRLMMALRGRVLKIAVKRSNVQPRRLMIQLYKVLQEGSACGLTGILPEVAYMVREAVANPSTSSTVSTLRCLLWNLASTTDWSADVLAAINTIPD